MKSSAMTLLERRAAISLAGIFSTRMLGLFMILPVFALYSEHLEGSTPLLIGLAIGVYGFTQAMFQIPFGMLSDRFGRKPMIYIALLIFAVGSVVAAMADSIVGVIIGRAIQGAGAIAAVVMALAADLTAEEHRLKAMAIIGASMGLSFSVALILGPIMNSWIGVDGIFWFTAVLALLAIVLLKFWVPDPEVSRFHRDTEPVPSQFKNVLKDGQLLRLDYGIFALHVILTATFVAMPLTLRDQAGLPSADHWMVYLGVVVIALFAMVPFIIIAEKKRKMKQIFVGAIILLMFSQITLVFVTGSVIGIVIALFMFFLAFNTLEASLPSLVAKSAPADKKGTAMGVYSSSQFFGAFVGGITGGWLYGYSGTASVFAFCAVMAGVWMLLAMTMKPPRHFGTYMINVGEVSEEQALSLGEEIRQVKGVMEATVLAEDGVAYLKIDSALVNEADLIAFSVNEDDDSAKADEEALVSRATV